MRMTDRGYIGSEWGFNKLMNQCITQKWQCAEPRIVNLLRGSM
jgi:hypothetical protein